MNSLWEHTADRPAFPSLQGDKSTDVLIIGGGMAGILCAYMLSRRGQTISSWKRTPCAAALPNTPRRKSPHSTG